MLFIWKGPIKVKKNSCYTCGRWCVTFVGVCYICGRNKSSSKGIIRLEKSKETCLRLCFAFRLFNGDATQKIWCMNPRIPIVTTFGGHEKVKFIGIMMDCLGLPCLYRTSRIHNRSSPKFYKLMRSHGYWTPKGVKLFISGPRLTLCCFSRASSSRILWYCCSFRRSKSGREALPLFWRTRATNSSTSSSVNSC